MAEPISDIKRMEMSRQEKVEQDVQEVKEVVSANKESIVKGIELLSALEEADALEAATALTKKRKTLLNNVIKEIDKPKYTDALDTLPNLIFLLGDLDIEETRMLLQRLNNGLRETEGEKEQEETSYTDIVKSLKDPDINRSITLLLQFLKGMGKD
ncbi:DUF1641 domain-containing protein [Salibacterium aidingense]|uniref:DUF1641 domain-containing protein n=1 Tax=Salibacterium aidingense TaxID=384933 RepID=UPI0004260404|nr:DUF1641 domain-containing protein [Salibacterium aidingense]